MSDDPRAATKPTVSTHHVPPHERRSWTVVLVVSALMVLFAMIGVGLTTARSSYAQTYWVVLVPVFGLLCVVTAWRRSGPDHPVDTRAVLRQVFHWLGITVAVALTFFIRQTGEETAEATALTSLLILSLGCFLAGIHLELLFVPVALLLTLTGVLVVKAEQYLWLIFLVGGALLVGLIVFRRALGAWRFRHDVPAAGK